MAKGQQWDLGVWLGGDREVVLWEYRLLVNPQNLHKS